MKAIAFVGLSCATLLICPELKAQGTVGGITLTAGQSYTQDISSLSMFSYVGTNNFTFPGTTAVSWTYRMLYFSPDYVGRVQFFSAANQLRYDEVEAAYGGTLSGGAFEASGNIGVLQLTTISGAATLEEINVQLVIGGYPFGNTYAATFTPVPEPSIFGLSLLAVLTIVFFGRCRMPKR